MTRCDWTWRPIERVNFDDAPTDDWRKAYHWLDGQVSGEVVVSISEDLEMIGYICEVDDE